MRDFNSFMPMMLQQAYTEPNVGTYGGNSQGDVGVASGPMANVQGDGKSPLAGSVQTAPTDKGGIVQHGQMASGSAMQEAGLLDNKMTRKVLDYHVRKYPFYTAMFTKASQMAWKGHKEAEYPEIGDIKTEARTTYVTTQGGTVTFKGGDRATVNTANINLNDVAIFRKNFTIFVQEAGDYCYGVDEDGNHETLMLYVTSVSEDSFTCVAVNGPTVSGSIVVPAIPAGSLLVLGAPALAEEEVEVDPINILPTMRNAYLQKKAYSVAITDFFDEAVKDVDWEKDRIKRQALDTYKKLYTTTALFGAKKKFYKKNKNGNRICYTQEGVMNQIRMAYQLPNNKWTKGALIGIAKMLFTAYTDAEEIEVFCGSDAIEGLLNIDWGTGVNQIKYMKDAEYNVEIATFNCTFGTLHFTHELALTQHHLEKAAIAIPMQDAIRLYRDNGSTKHVDGNKGETGNVEELTKDFFVQDDCFICNAMNTMLIGPSEVFSNKYAESVKEKYFAVDTLADSLKVDGNVGKIYYLTTPTSTNVAGLYKLTKVGETFSFEAYTRDETRAYKYMS